MRLIALALIASAALVVCACGDAEDSVQPSAAVPASSSDGRGVLRFEMQRLDGTPERLSRYLGKVTLVVNTASECGFTSQFEGLEQLYRDRRGDGLVILGFPADDVAGQEPRSDAAIAEFCRANFGVSFPMFAKVKVTGDDAAPLFKALGEPNWNFNKYLLDRRGRLLDRWGATTEPDDPELTTAIEAQLRS
jgi:glutathione peroxidase